MIKKSASLARSDNLPTQDRTTSGGAIKNKIISKLAEELHKPIIRKYKKGKVHLSFIDIIWSVDMQLKRKFDKEIQFLLCVIDVFSKYASVISLKETKCITITNLQKILDESNCKPNKAWVDKDGEFCNRSIKSRLDVFKMYSTHNEWKSVVAQYLLQL